MTSGARAGGPTRPGAAGGDTGGTSAPARSAKGEQTRVRILDTALRLFREQGYEATTMRSIAHQAGVSLGNSYYYFPTKGHLVQAFYAALEAEHQLRVGRVLETETGLAARLRGVIHAHLDVVEPYHGVSAVLFRTAADPQSPINPFSEASRPVREQAVAIFAEAVAGSDARVPADLREDLPRLLWLWHMGLVLFWIHDRSPAQRRTRALADESTELIVRLLALAQLPLLRATRRRAIALVRSLMSDSGGAAGENPAG